MGSIGVWTGDEPAWARGAVIYDAPGGWFLFVCPDGKQVHVPIEDLHSSLKGGGYFSCAGYPRRAGETNRQYRARLYAETKPANMRRMTKP